MKDELALLEHAAMLLRRSDELGTLMSARSLLLTVLDSLDDKITKQSTDDGISIPEHRFPKH